MKNCSPNYLANAGYCSTTDSFILQFLSSLKSLRAGTMLCCKFSRPITLLRSSSLLKRFNLTSDDSSLSKAKKIGRICSFVGPFSIIGHIAAANQGLNLITRAGQEIELKAQGWNGLKKD